MRKWVIMLLVSVFVMSGCGVYLWIEQSKRDDRRVQADGSAHTMNQIRLMVSDTLAYMEQNHRLIADNPAMLHSIIQNHSLNVLFINLEGHVIYDSNTNRSLSHIDPKTAVHYDLYSSRKEPDKIEVAFPVTDITTGRQIGHAIYTIPVERLVKPEKSTLTYVFIIAIPLSALLVVILVVWLVRKLKRDVMIPVHQLTLHSEAIVKGDYDQRVEYLHGGEMGGLYSMFDQMRMEMIDLNQRRDAGEKAHKELISNISHDLKTPLATLRVYIEAIRDGVCPDMEKVQEYVEVMYTQSNKMTGLIDDLMIHALRELGQITVKLTEQYSGPLFERMLAPIGHFIATKGVIYEGPNPIPDVLIKVDVVRMEQVITNLVANALKHTSAGDRISVHIDHIGADEDDSNRKQSDMLRVTIADTGEGILPKDIPFIFERYYQGQSIQSAAVGGQGNEGSGLGLSICKTIVEAHGGNISFHSRVNQGTTFYFTIPVG